MSVPVVFLHGFPLDSSMWREQEEFFKQRCDVFSLDLPGFGDSKKVAPDSIEGFAEDVKSFLDENKIKKVVLCGFSMGGYIALAFYEKYPQFVKALVLVDTRAKDDRDAGKKLRNVAIEEAEKNGTVFFVENMPSRLLSEEGMKNPIILERVRKTIAKQRKESIKNALIAMRDRKDRSFLLNGIEVPTLFICGERDVLTPPQEMKEMSLKVKNSRFEIIKNAAHLSNIENPAQFNALLNNFLESLGG